MLHSFKISPLNLILRFVLEFLKASCRDGCDDAWEDHCLEKEDRDLQQRQQCEALGLAHRQTDCRFWSDQSGISPLQDLV